MRTNLQIDDDVYKAAERRAAAENRSVGEVLSDLARKALKAERGPGVESRFLVFSVPEGSPPITLEMVKAAEADL
ncbi:MAG TPA: CopG family transcriptional regulator [Thermoanaerobaculia bacterium]|nr:CopG family transcriptional regulator [Thermoanaerobaculia bacterium]